MYKGVIIEESLENTDVLKKLSIVSTERESVVPGHKTPWLEQWTLHAVEIPESHAQEFAEEISRALDSKHEDSWYADFKNDHYHYVIFLNKLFFIDRSRKAQYDEAIQYGRSIGIPEHQLDFQNG